MSRDMKRVSLPFFLAFAVWCPHRSIQFGSWTSFEVLCTFYGFRDTLECLYDKQSARTLDAYGIQAGRVGHRQSSSLVKWNGPYSERPPLGSIRESGHLTRWLPVLISLGCRSMLTLLVTNFCLMWRGLLCKSTIWMLMFDDPSISSSISTQFTVFFVCVFRLVAFIINWHEKVTWRGCFGATRLGKEIAAFLDSRK